jgi:hypothetical protein
MAIIDVTAHIHRDTAVARPQVFVTQDEWEGQHCGTVWFFNAADARDAIRANGGIPLDGHQAGLCEQCACRHKGQEFPPFACAEWKEAWTLNPARGPETTLETQPLAERT